jgi:hypothetical protein
MRLKAAAAYAALVAAILFGGGPAVADPYSDRIDILYETPEMSEHAAVYEVAKERRLLETIRDMVAPLRLPGKLTLRLKSCNGDPNAWYDNETVTVTVCYDFVEFVWKNVPPKTTPLGLSPVDAFVGPIVDIFLHEVGHAAFDVLKIPVFGREEDAADQFSVFMMLKFKKEEARRLILGTAYQYKADIEQQTITTPLKAFADDHATPPQRYFNVLCLAYGADPALFGDFVSKGHLPEGRARSCGDEYRIASFAFNTLIGPHIDVELARKFEDDWLPPIHTQPPARR